MDEQLRAEVHQLAERVGRVEDWILAVAGAEQQAETSLEDSHREHMRRRARRRALGGF